MIGTVLRFSVDFVVVFVGVPIYIVFLLTIYKFRKQVHFKNSFFVLIASCGVADLMYLGLWYMGFRLPEVGYLVKFYKVGGVPLATGRVATYMYWQHVQVLGVLIMSSNRLTALSTLGHDQLWSKRNIVVALCLQYLLPTLTAIPFVGPCQYKSEVRRNGTSEGVLALDPSLRGFCSLLSFGVLAIVQVSVSVILVFMYLVMFYKAWKRAKKIVPVTRNTARQQRARKVQINLAFSGLFISLGLVSVANHSAFGAVFFKETRKHAYIYYPLGGVLSDIYSLINPIAILITSKKVRAYYWLTVKAIFCLKPTPAYLSTLNNP